MALQDAILPPLYSAAMLFLPAVAKPSSYMPLQSGLFCAALRFRSLRGTGVSVPLRALSILRQSSGALRRPGQQMARVSAVAAPAQVWRWCQLAGACCQVVGGPKPLSC